MTRKQTERVNKLLKLLIVALIILLLLLLLRDFNIHKLAVARNLDRTNQTVHNLQLEFETLKVTNLNLIKQMAAQQARIKELETLQRVIVSEPIPIEQPTVHNVPVDAPQTTPEKKTIRYLDYIPHEMIVIVVGTLELTRQILMPQYNFN